MRRGEIGVARLNPNQGAEVGELRPVVIIQEDPITQAGLATVIVVPLTTQDRQGSRALRVPIQSRDRLLRDALTMADQPRSLDRSRLGDGPLTTLSRDDLAQLERALLGGAGPWPRQTARCWLRTLTRLAMDRPLLIRNDRGAAIAALQTGIGAVLWSQETCACDCAFAAIDSSPDMPIKGVGQGQRREPDRQRLSLICQ